MLLLIEILALLLCLRICWSIVRRAFFVANDFDNVPGPQPVSRVMGELCYFVSIEIVAQIMIRVD